MVGGVSPTDVIEKSFKRGVEICSTGSENNDEEAWAKWAALSGTPRKEKVGG
jgi:hypothetical protein